jgi:hypothetical protein
VPKITEGSRCQQQTQKKELKANILYTKSPELEVKSHEPPADRRKWAQQHLRHVKPECMSHAAS